MHRPPPPPKSRTRPRHQSSGLQPLDLPPPAPRPPPVPDPVVQPTRAPLPELDRVRHHPEAAPVRRLGDGALGVARLQRGLRRLQLAAAAGRGGALVADPGADLRGWVGRGRVGGASLRGWVGLGALLPHRGGAWVKISGRATASAQHTR